jgi:predicted nucleic acid-binding protein
VTLYLDTSALLPYYRAEAHSAAVQRFFARQREPLGISPLTRVELASALSRWVRTAELAERDANRVENAFHEDLAARRFRVHAIPAEAYERAVHWLLARRTGLRTLDALHLACAEAAGASLVTLDDAFAGAARALGVTTVRID